MSAPIAFDPPDPSDLSELLQGYQVTSLIAAGGMGAVYKATQLSLERSVAIKLLPAEFGEDPSFRERFHAEARAMARLNHANLIGIYDFGEAGDMPYIVMELVSGKSLHHSSHGKAIDQTLAVKIVIGICRGLAHAHQSGVIHRDIKPANILLDEETQPKIGDFGLAAAADADDEGPLFGTPGYAAPEVYQDPKAINATFDIYAVGIILYELLTGSKPEEPPSPPSSVGGCDKRLDPIVKKAIRRDPGLRYQDAAEMARDLEKLLPNLGKSGQRTIRTGADAGAQRAVTLKRKTDDEKDPPDQKSKPRLVPLAKGESSPASRLRPLSEKPAEQPKPQAGTPAAPSAKQSKSSPDPAPVAVGNGSNWPIIRNLLIIAILIPIIIFTWGIYEKKQAKRDAEREEQRAEKLEKEREREALAAKNEREREERARRKAEEAAREALAEKRRLELLAIEEAKTPMERLAEVRSALFNGRRDQFPDGTIDRSTHFLFFVETPMTWGEAAQFAEAHGGHLATPAKRAEVDVLTKRMGNDLKRIWLGGGAQGKGGWAWVTGEEWRFPDPGTTLGSCASLSNTGVIRARSYGEKNPFVIQWSTDGENPGSLAAQLERLVPTLDTPSPEWPPTTVAQDSRHFLLVQKELSWEEADLVAASGEGHLAVVSETSEAIFLRNFFESSLLPGQSAWLGGQKEEDRWSWSTGEPWNKASWAAGSPDGGESETALRFLQRQEGPGWDDASPEAGSASGFVIEWSADAQRDEVVGETASDDPIDQFIKTRQVARRLLGREVDDYQKFLAANRDSFLTDARVWFRILNKSKKEAFREGYLALIDNLPEDGNLPGPVTIEGAPEELRKYFERAVERQENRKTKFENKLESLRKSYLGKLAAFRDQFEKNGLKSQMKTIESEIAEVGQTVESFRAAFGE